MITIEIQLGDQLYLGQSETLLCRQVVEQPTEVVEVFLAALSCKALMFVDKLNKHLPMFSSHPTFSSLDLRAFGFCNLRIDQIEIEETFGKRTVEKNLNIEDEKSRVDQIEPGQGRTLILCPSLSSHLSSDGDDDIDDGIDYLSGRSFYRHLHTRC